jgi:ParB family chromosome partitioning protein
MSTPVNAPDKRKALGRGLDALLPTSRPPASSSSTGGAQGGIREVEAALIDRNPYQTRGKVDEAALNELAASIKASGVVQPIIVRPLPNGRFQLMAGERRWLASQRAGHTTVPAVVRPASDAQALEITIIENLQREDLNAIEQARAFDRLAREFSMTQEQIAQRTGKDRASIANFLRLLRLPAEIQSAVESNQLSFGHAKVLLMLHESPEALLKAAEKVIQQSLSVRATEELVQRILHPEPKAAPKPRQLDPNVRQAEQEMQRTLGCKVQIDDHKGIGKIVIQYASLEDFDRVVEMLGKK